MNIKIEELEKFYDNNEHKAVIKKLTASNPNDLPFELKLHLARAYNNQIQYDKAIVLLNPETQKGETNAFWNYLMCFSYYRKAMRIWPNIHFYKGKKPLEDAFELMTKAKYYNEMGLKIDEKSENLNFFKPHISNYHKQIEKDIIKSRKSKPKKVKIAPKEYDAKYSKIFEEYFNKISSDTLKLHKTANSWNWDNDDSYLFVIAKNKNTDLGTALMLFWQGQPHSYWFPYISVEDVEKHNKKGYELLELLYQNISNNFYTQGHIAYNPKSDYGTNWTEAHNSKKISSLFFKKTEGKKIKSNYTEGFPNGVWNKVNKLNEQFYYE